MFSLEFLCSRPWRKTHFYNKGDEFNRRLAAKWKFADLDTGRKLPIKQLLREQALNLSTHFDIEENIGITGYFAWPA